MSQSNDHAVLHEISSSCVDKDIKSALKTPVFLWHNGNSDHLQCCKDQIFLVICLYTVFTQFKTFNTKCTQKKETIMNSL